MAKSTQLDKNSFIELLARQSKQSFCTLIIWFINVKRLKIDGVVNRNVKYQLYNFGHQTSANALVYNTIYRVDSRYTNGSITL